MNKSPALLSKVICSCTTSNCLQVAAITFCDLNAPIYYHSPLKAWLVVKKKANKTLKLILIHPNKLNYLIKFGEISSPIMCVKHQASRHPSDTENILYFQQNLIISYIYTLDTVLIQTVHPFCSISWDVNINIFYTF